MHNATHSPSTEPNTLDSLSLFTTGGQFLRLCGLTALSILWGEGVIMRWAVVIVISGSSLRSELFALDLPRGSPGWQELPCHVAQVLNKQISSEDREDPVLWKYARYVYIVKHSEI